MTEVKKKIEGKKSPPGKYHSNNGCSRISSWMLLSVGGNCRENRILAECQSIWCSVSITKGKAVILWWRNPTDTTPTHCSRLALPGITPVNIMYTLKWCSEKDTALLLWYSYEKALEVLMLQLKLQYFGHLMQRADSLEKTLILGKT